MTWQTIETAPLNVPVLIWDGEIMCVAEQLQFNYSKIKYWNCIGASGWECENDFSSPPTHWMLLPEPPTQQD